MLEALKRAIFGDPEGKEESIITENPALCENLPTKKYITRAVRKSKRKMAKNSRKKNRR